MGNVFFDTEVNKNVNINKNVNVSVNKNVQTDVELNGSLAEAEASADATGGTAGGGGGASATFLVDDFNDTQFIQANALQGPNPVEDTIGITTDIPNGQRRLFVEVLSDEGIAQLGANNPQASKLDFSSTNNAFTNALAEYTSTSGAFDPTPGVSNADILADPAGNTFSFSDIDFDPGTGGNGQPATVRASLVFEDANGDQAITTVAFVPGAGGQGFQDLEIVGSLAFLLDDTLDVPGTVVDTDPVSGGQIISLGSEDDVDGGGDGVDLDQVTSIQILLEDRPDTNTDGNGFNSGDFFAVDSVIDENLSVDGTDTSVDDFVLEINVQNVFHIAETETFAQVTEDGAFSFSDALAARSGAITDDSLL